MYTDIPLRPPLASVKPSNRLPRYVRILNAGSGARTTSRRRADELVRMDIAVWDHGRLRILGISRGRRRKRLDAQGRQGDRVETCAAIAIRRYEIERSERETQAPGQHTAAEWDALRELYGNQCLRCGSTDQLTKDHIIPLSEGGSDSASNLQPLCLPCNSWKGARIIDFRPTEGVSVTA